MVRKVNKAKVNRAIVRTSRYGFRVLGVLAALIALVVGGFVWRVSSSPLDISFVKKSIESAIYDSSTGNYIRMEKAVLFWPDLNGPLYLQIHNGQFFNKDGALIGSIGQIDASFSSLGLLVGRLMPKAIIIKEPTVRLVRNEDGSISFDIASDIEEEEKPEKETLVEEEDSEILQEVLSYIASPVREGGVRSGALLSQLRGFAIEDARLFVDDRVLHQTWSLPDFDLAFMSTTSGAGGYAHMALPGADAHGPALDIAVDYDWWNGRIDLSTDIIAFDLNEIINKVPALAIPANQDAVVSAHIEVTLNDESLMPTEVRIDALSDGGQINHSDLSDEPIPYKKLALSVLYDYAGKTLQLRDTHISLGGVTFNFSGNLTRTQDKVFGPVRIWAKDVEHALIEPIWPKFLKGDDAEKWIVQRMSDGVFEDLSVSFDVMAEKHLKQLPVSQIEPEAGEPQDAEFEFVADESERAEEAEVVAEEPEEPVELWIANVKNVSVDFKAKEMSVNYHAPLAKATNLYGSGKFDVDNDSLSIDIEKAKLGNMDVGVSKLFFDRLVEEGVGDADMRFKLKGTIANVMRYISTEPIALGDDIGMDIEKVKGDAALDIYLNFPARKDVLMSQFKIDIGGDLTDVLFPAVVKELDISGGPLKIAVKDNTVKVEGDALLDGHKTKLAWDAFLKSKGQAYEEKVEASLRVDKELRDKLGIDLSDFMEGALDTTLTYTSYKDGTSKADIVSDITPARLFITPFDYEKPVGEEGKTSFQAFLKEGALQKLTGLSASAPDFTLKKGEVKFTQEDGEVMLGSGSTPNFTLGETVGALSFEYDEHRVVDIKLDGKVLDGRPFMNSDEVTKTEATEEGQEVEAAPKAEEKYDAPPMRIHAEANKVRLEADEWASDFSIYMEIDDQGRFNQMNMNGHIGSSDVAVRFNKAGNDEGKRTFRMRTEDAGTLLKAFGIYDNIIGGTMAIYGEPVEGAHDRNMSGQAEIADFKVVKAPALAKLLSLLSLGGIGDVLSDGGLDFDRMEADYGWEYRKAGSLLKIRDGRTSGNTLGILFDGSFDFEKREIDVAGTVAPMAGLNSIIGGIPLVGDILTGGSGGVFAATYSITGSSEDPKVSVNPLSVLTPGILRRILWEKSPE